MSAVTSAPLGREFDTFLYASVCNDNNGMPLTVLSALARLDIDPWEEASTLTKMPPQGAVTQLASLLSGLRTASLPGLDPVQIAGSLVALLPRPRHRAPLTIKAFVRETPIKYPAAFSTLLSMLPYFILLLLSQWLMWSVLASAPIQASPTSTPTTDSPSAVKAGEGP